jgi:hypothetical protein
MQPPCAARGGGPGGCGGLAAAGRLMAAQRGGRGGLAAVACGSGPAGRGVVVGSAVAGRVACGGG